MVLQSSRGRSVMLNFSQLNILFDEDDGCARRSIRCVSKWGFMVFKFPLVWLYENF